MPRGRTPRVAQALRSAVSTALEPLEPRQLLTVLAGGQTLDYYDANKNTIRIQLVGEILAEFIGANVRNDNSVVIRDLVDPPPEGFTGPYDGVDLFQIYVAAANPGSQIIITQISVNDDGEVTADPYGGNAGEIKIQPANGQMVQTVTPAGGGQVYIGARTKPLVDGEGQADQRTADFPIIYNRRYSTLGDLRPASKGIYAGIQTAPGVNIDKILIGGTVTGNVYIDGNVGTFYAGDVLTGNVGGLTGNDTSSLPNNFSVNGDLQNFVVGGSVGTTETVGAMAPVNRTGFDMRIGGKLGNVRIGEEFVGSVEVNNNPDLQGLTTPIDEVEYVLGEDETLGSAFLNGLIADDIASNDDRVNGAQFGSTYTSSLTGVQQSIEWTGILDDERGDAVDTYGLPLIAGQKVIIQLEAGGLANVGIIDPLGRLVASDYRDAAGDGVNESFIFTAKLPGTYKLVVANAGDSAFNGGGEFELGLVPYTLSVRGAGEVALGGAHIGGTSFMGEQSVGVSVRTGDLGAWQAEDRVLASLLSSFRVSRGNLRELFGGDIGSTSTLATLSPDLIVPRGAIGYVHATDFLDINPLAVGLNDQINPEYMTGFDVQRVEAGGSMIGNVVTRRAIGTIKAGSIPSNPLFYANADRTGEDGRIDLIDVEGDLGSALTGGPGLFTGVGGNVKYVRVGGATYRDYFFGGVQQTVQNGQIGQSFTIVDDSGARALLTPTTIADRTPANGGGNGNGGTTDLVSTTGSLTITTYGVRESGGVVVVDVTSSTGLTVTSPSRAGQFDISHFLSTFDTATPVVFDADVDNPVVGYEPLETNTPIPGAPPINPLDPTALTTFAPSSNDFVFSGRIPINVMEIEAINPAGGLEPINTLNNTSPGEIGGVLAGTIGNITAQSVGYIKSSTASDIVVDTNIPATQFATYPYDDYSFGVVSQGPVISIRSREAIGTVYSYASTGEENSGAIGEISANADGANGRGIFEGIIGVVGAERILRVNVGEGLPFSGTGDVVYGGLFAIDTPVLGLSGADIAIDQIIANNADIRGVIASEGKLGQISVRNGVISGARILTPTSVDQANFTHSSGYILNDINSIEIEVTAPGADPTAPPTIITRTSYSLDYLKVTNGGIIGSSILLGDFNAIDVSGGFGIIGTQIAAVASYNPNGAVGTDGLGIRKSSITAGNSINRIEARGDGQVLNMQSFPASLRQSETGVYDSYSGRLLSTATDLHVALGTSRRSSRVSGITNAGIIEDTEITGSLNLGSMRAYVIRDGLDNDIANGTRNFPMRVAFANSTGKIEARNAIDGLYVVTGRLDQLTAGGQAANLRVDVSGRIGTIAVGRNLRGNSYISARGPEGSIDRIYTRLGNYATIHSNLSINRVEATTFGGRVETINKISNVSIIDDVVSGAYIYGNKGIGTLNVGGDVQSGATIKARSFGTTNIGGEVDGTITTS